MCFFKLETVDIWGYQGGRWTGTDRAQGTKMSSIDELQVLQVHNCLISF